MVAIITFTGASAFLIAGLAIAALNVVVRRESADVVEKQIQVLVQASRSIALAMLDHTDVCVGSPTNSGALEPLAAYTDEAFPQALTSLTVENAKGVRSLVRWPVATRVKPSAWLPETGFAGLVVDRGQIEIRNVVIQQRGACNATAIFSLPLESELAERLSSAAGIEVTTALPRQFRIHPSQRVLRTILDNFIPGISRPAAVVLSVRDWETGAMEDWVAYSVQPSISNTRQIAGGNFGWRTPVRSKGQLGELICNFNEMAIALGTNWDPLCGRERLAGPFGDNRYASLLWAEYNTHTGTLTYVNAGHPAPILTRSTGEIERLDSGGVPIGMFANARYTGKTVQMQPDTRLVIFTDGVTDAQNAAEEEFGDERLVECCTAIAAEIDANGVADKVMQAVAQWSGGSEQFDDTTVVVLNVAA